MNENMFIFFSNGVLIVIELVTNEPAVIPTFLEASCHSSTECFKGFAEFLTNNCAVSHLIILLCHSLIK